MIIHTDVSGKLSREGLKPIEDKFQRLASERNFTKYITNQLPHDFSPRFFLYKENCILVALSETDADRLIERVVHQGSDKNSEETITSTQFKSLDKLTINYLWSGKRYMKWCSKLAFEFLCLFKGASFCLREEFDAFRTQILQRDKYDEHIIPYEDKKGLRVGRLTAPGWVSYVNVKKSIKGFPLIGTSRPNRHKIVIYESDEYILASVQLFKIEPCQLIMGKSISMSEIYYIEYDYINDVLEFYIASKTNATRYSFEKHSEFIERIANIPNSITATFYSEDERPFFTN
jgi:hypothetical protein